MNLQSRVARSRDVSVFVFVFGLHKLFKVELPVSIVSILSIATAPPPIAAWTIAVGEPIERTDWPGRTVVFSPEQPPPV